VRAVVERLLAAGRWAEGVAVVSRAQLRAASALRTRKGSCVGREATAVRRSSPRPRGESSRTTQPALEPAPKTLTNTANRRNSRHPADSQPNEHENQGS
jgi:hypothetical protein